MAIYTYKGKSADAVEIFDQNVSIQRMYDAQSATSYVMTRINKKRIDGNMQYPFVRCIVAKTTAYELAANENWYLVLNASYGSGFVIQNGVNVGTQELQQGRRPLLVSTAGDLSALDLDQWHDAGGVPPGCVSAVSGWGPLVIDYEDYTIDDQYHTDSEGSVATIHAQRQIIGQYAGGDYCILTCEGRNYDNSAGWTYEEARRVIHAHGLKFAYNLDGGGSTQIVVGRKNLNLIYEGTYGRNVPNFLVFNGDSAYGRPG